MLHNSAQPLRIVSSSIVTTPCLKELKPACCGCCRGPSEQTSDSFLANEWILMPSKSDVTDLSGSPGFYHGLDCATRCEDPVRVFQSNNLVELHQVDAIRLQPPQRFVDLPGGGLPGPAINLRHEEDSLAVAVTQRLSHADLADAAIIIPAVIHEGEPAIDGAPDNRYTLRF